MAELSSHSYHYKDSIFNQQQIENESDDEENSKKKTRRRKRMLTGVSKQRRAANERERKRLQIINMAYKELKSALPLFPNEDNIPKIEIVRLATRTIRYLSDILNNNDRRNDLDHIRGRRSSEYSDISGESSPERSINNIGDLTNDIKLENIDNDIDVSNLLFQPDDIKLEFDPSPHSDIDGSSMSSSDGFQGLDISSFLGGGASSPGHVPTHEDVFPSMLYW